MKKLSTNKLTAQSVINTMTMVTATTILLTLSGCAAPTINPDGTSPVSTGVGIGKAVFKSAVDAKCRTSMTSNQYWKTASLLIPQVKQDEIQTSVCGCVSDKAVESATPANLATAVIDRNAFTQLVATSVTASFNGCYGEITKSLNLSK